MNSVRLLMTWAAIEPQKGAYDTSYLQALRARLDWAQAAGLRVILDMHQDLYGEGFGGDGAPRWTCDEARYAAFKPATPWYLGNLDPNLTACDDAFYSDPDLQSHFLGAWQAVAEALHDHPAVLGFDALNEPYWGSRSMFGYEADTLERARPKRARTASFFTRAAGGRRRSCARSEEKCGGTRNGTAMYRYTPVPIGPQAAPRDVAAFARASAIRSTRTIGTKRTDTTEAQSRRCSSVHTRIPRVKCSWSC